MNKSKLLTILYAVEVLQGSLNLEDIAHESVRENVRAVVENKGLVNTLLASQILDGVETVDTLPLVLREEVQSLLSGHKTYKLLLVANVLNGELSIDEVPSVLKEDVEKSVNEYLS